VADYLEGTAPARVARELLPGWPVSDRDGQVEGMLLSFKPLRRKEAINKLREIEGPGYHLIDAKVSTVAGEQDAQLFRWRGLDNLNAYLDAVRRKVAIAAHELASLERRVHDLDPSDIEAPVGVQADFEGVLYAFDAAADQLTNALGVRKREFASTLPPGHPCLSKMTDWFADPVIEEVAFIRNDATHAYYHKRMAPHLWKVSSVRRSEPREFDEDILTFATRAVAHLQELLPILDCIEASSDLPDTA
jgi:hypothetical protein